MNRQTPNKHGFAIIELLITLIVLLIAAGIAWFAVQSHRGAPATQTSDTVKVTSFATCREAKSSHMLDTYPVKCIAKDGTIYVNPSQTPNNNP